MAGTDEVCKTGVAGFDEILRGGLPRNRLYLLEGAPGTGKTTLGMQFLLEGARAGEPGMYISFSETAEELYAVAVSHGWQLGEVTLCDMGAIAPQLNPDAQSTLFHPADLELNQTTQLIFAEIDRVKPLRIVFDTVSEVRTLAQTTARYRRHLLVLKHFFSRRKNTVIFLDDLIASDNDMQMHSVVHGVFRLEKYRADFGSERRQINIAKLRGVRFVGGNHDYTIERGGLQVYPRLIATNQSVPWERQTLTSGLSGLDDLLGGGLDRGTSSLFMGPAGSGKSTLAFKFAVEAANRGEGVAMFLFDETLETLLSRVIALGMDPRPSIDKGTMHVQTVDPAELTPGEFTSAIRRAVEQNDARMIVIDSLNGYLHATPMAQHVVIQLHELLSYLGRRGVTTILVLTQQGMMGSMQSPVDLTYLSDTVLLTRYFEAAGAVRKAATVLKKRSGWHENTIREFSIHAGKAIVVGPALSEFHGVLTGVPKYVGRDEQMLDVGTDGKR